ncbi:uncharacterized protein EDB91DRAFT_1255321 [Suillus paluster]|uniref:uncharacterized protein n=1 Tax=Suillus paluster TaxID=48578 RepID=UPI001B8784FE|nr:uncharacterized protein EDB91DRAFT_1255321 [Suillus paluster]KAG1724229.1 hypothetical protein EDB91DRAFT_1255321 [Suillus paluster]
MLLDTAQDEWQEGELPDEGVINVIWNGRHQAECLKLLQKLTVGDEHPSHHGQNEDGTPVDPDGLEAQWSDDEDALGMNLPADRKVKLAKLFKANKLLTECQNCNSIVPHAIGTHIQLQLDMPPDVQDTTDSQHSVSASASLPLAAYASQRWLQDDHTFDSYEGGPIIEMLMTPRESNPAMTLQAGGIQISTAWVDWVDHGYHITPSSFHMFYQCDPIATMDHIMPIGTPDSYNPSNQVPDCVTGAYSLDRLGSEDGEHHTQVTDVEILSAAELIDSAQYDPPLHDDCRFRHNSFVRGRTSNHYGDSPALYFDLEQDAVAFSEDEIEISVDIDSIIWTTKLF